MGKGKGIGGGDYLAGRQLSAHFLLSVGKPYCLPSTFCPTKMDKSLF